MTARMPRRDHALHLVSQLRIAMQQKHSAFLQKRSVILGCVCALRAQIWVAGHRPFDPLHAVAGIREYRHRQLTIPLGVASAMIAMKVRVYHDVNVLRRDPHASQILDQPAVTSP